MSLSNDLIAKFVKFTNDSNKTNNGTVVYGTVKRKFDTQGQKFYVILDGTDSEIPISLTEGAPNDSAVDVRNGDRVLVTIKNHVAVVTSNLSAISARKNDERIVSIGEVKGRIEDLEFDNVRINDTLTTYNANINDLTTKYAKIGTLEAENVEIREELKAQSGRIDQIVSEGIDTEVLDARYAKLEEFESVQGTVYQLDATHAKIDFSNIEEAHINNLAAKLAEFGHLSANEADIEDLKADVAKIDKLIFGEASGNVIQTEFANNVISQVGDAQIKSAMIESVSASKVSAGTIHTNDVTIESEEGDLRIEDGTIQIFDGDNVRIQIGRDANGDYSIIICDAEGNVMLNADGLTSYGIKDAIIRNDMVSETANIAASKLNIDSLFEVINDSSNTIKATQITVDEEGQTLSVAFKALTTDLEGLQNDVSSQGTKIEAVLGQISSKVWQQDIDAATGTLTTKYTELQQNVNGIESSVTKYTTEFNESLGTTHDLAEGASAGVTEAKSLIQQLSESISMMVTDGKGTSLMTQTEDGWTFSTAEIHEAISAASEGLDSLTNQLGSTDAAVDVLQQAMAELGTLSEYVRITTYSPSGSTPEPEVRTWTWDGNTDGLEVESYEDYWTGNGYINVQLYKVSDEVIDPSFFADGAVVTYDSGVVNTYSIDDSGWIGSDVRIGSDGIWFSWGVRSLSAATGSSGGSDDSGDTPGTSPTDPMTFTWDGDTHGESGITIPEDTLYQYYFYNIHSGGVDVSGYSSATVTYSYYGDEHTYDAIVMPGSSGYIVQSSADHDAPIYAVVNDEGVWVYRDWDGGYISSVTFVPTTSTFALTRSTNDLEPCIELGEADSDFKLRITNTRMMFVEGSNELAHFDNHSMYIQKVVIEDELQQGNFVWKTRSNGNVGLVWKGGSS